MASDQVSGELLSEARDTLMKKCKLDDKALKKLFSVLRKFRSRAEHADDMIEKFADRCYKSAGSSSFEQAKNFCHTAFGDLERLWRQGPNEAFALRTREVAEAIGGKPSGGKRRSQWEFEFGKYYVGHTLGVGGTSKVLLGMDKDSNTEVAIKVYKTKYAKTAAKEGNILKNLDHPNIIKVYDTFENCEWMGEITTVMVMEYANKGELIEYLMYTKRFEAPLARWIFKGVLAALNYCHSKKIVHRDMKHDNCLFGETVDGEWVVKINDFGFSKELEVGEMMKSMIGTEQYAAPEILRCKKYDERVDIFALGVMMFVALSGCQPFQRADRNDPWYKRVVVGKWEKFWKSHNRGASSYQFTASEKQLLQGMLEYEPADRWSLREICEHEWANGETYSTEKAMKKLKSRKRRMDDAKYVESMNGKKPHQHRDIAANFIPAPEYYTNIPDGGLWFYSADFPSAIVEGVANVIQGEPFKGTTDYSTPFPENEERRRSSSSSRRMSDASCPTVKRLQTEIKGNTARLRMKEKEFLLNFKINYEKGRDTEGRRIMSELKGFCQVFSCPDDEKVSIVKFIPGHGADTLRFQKVYDDLMSGDPDAAERNGLATMMLKTSEVMKQMREKEEVRMELRRSMAKYEPRLSLSSSWSSGEAEEEYLA